MSNPDFIWNVNSAEEVRAVTERVLSGQAGDLRRRAFEALELAKVHEEEADRLEGLPHATRSESYTYTEEVFSHVNSAGDRVYRTVTRTGTKTVNCSVLQAARVEQIRILRELVLELRKAARKLDEEAYELIRVQRRANELFRELFEIAQNKDARYAERMMDKKREIEHYLDKIRVLRDSIGIAVNRNETRGDVLMNPTSFAWEWEMFERILSRPAAEINNASFAMLAWFYQKQGVEGQERFLNLFPERVELAGVRNPYGLDAFTICPDKVAGVKWFLDAGVNTLLHAQSNLPRGSAEYEALVEERHRLMQLSGLLSAIDAITDSAAMHVGSGLNVNAQQRVLLDVGADSLIQLADNGLGGFTLTFSRGVIENTPEALDMNFTTMTPVLNPESVLPRNERENRWQTNVSDILPSTITVSTVLSGAGLDRENTVATAEHFYLLYQFNLWEHVARETIGVGVGALPLPAGASIGIDFARLFTSIGPAREQAQSIQSDFVAFKDNMIFGDFQSDFYFEGVIVLEEGKLPIIVSYPTLQTQDALWALNGVLMRNSSDLSVIAMNPDSITQPLYSWADFMQNPGEVFNAYATLNGVGITQFGRALREIDAMRSSSSASQAIQNTETPPSPPPTPELPRSTVNGNPSADNGEIDIESIRAKYGSLPEFE